MEYTNAIRSVRVGNITVNLHNVGYLEMIDSVNDAEKPTKALWIYYVGGRNTLLYNGNPKTCEQLYEYINAAMGQFLDLTYLTDKEGAE